MTAVELGSRWVYFMLKTRLHHVLKTNPTGTPSAADGSS